MLKDGRVHYGPLTGRMLTAPAHWLKAIGIGVTTASAVVPWCVVTYLQADLSGFERLLWSPVSVTSMLVIIVGGIGLTEGLWDELQRRREVAARVSETLDELPVVSRIVPADVKAEVTAEVVAYHRRRVAAGATELRADFELDGAIVRNLGLRGFKVATKLFDVKRVAIEYAKGRLKDLLPKKPAQFGPPSSP